jgi:glycosyltransferase involved in cell wall biosynthesis
LKIVIRQNHIPEYRKAFFQKLSENTDLTVYISRQFQNPRVDLEGINVVYFNSFRIWRFKFSLDLYNWFNFRQADVIVFMFDLEWPIENLMCLSFFRSRAVSWGYRKSRNSGVNVIRNFLFKRFKNNILYSTEDLNYLRAQGYKNYTVARNTLDVPRVLLSNRYRNKLIFVGRLQKRKRVIEIIEQFKIYMEMSRSSDIEFVIVGPSADISEAELKNFVLSKNLSDRVLLKGECYDAETLSDLFLHSFAYISDNVGLGSLQALAFGCPVITSAGGGAGAIPGERHGPEFSTLKESECGFYWDSISEIPSLIAEARSNISNIQHRCVKYYYNNLTLERYVKDFIKGCDLT